MTCTVNQAHESYHVARLVFVILWVFVVLFHGVWRKLCGSIARMGRDC